MTSFLKLRLKKLSYNSLHKMYDSAGKVQVNL